MRLYTKIIVEERQGHWSASFADRPSVAFGGEWPSQAIFRLLEAWGAEQFDESEILACEDATQEGYLEFLIPLSGRIRIPQPSLN